jgi:SAM-dependent methyltransferase
VSHSEHRLAPPDAFGRVAEHYELGRPGWPEAAVDWAVEDAGIGSSAAVLDLAAGTGKLTRLLVRRFARVVAVEPDAAMRAKLNELVPKAETFAGAAEAIPLPDTSIDAAFVAEAFHWFDAVRALAEFARVLRSRGVLVLLWNDWTSDLQPPLPEEAEQAVQRRLEQGGVPGGPRYRSGAWREPFAASSFEELRTAQFDNELIVDREGMISNRLSISSIASLEESEQCALAHELRKLAPEATYRLPLRTDVYWTKVAG